MIIELPDPPNVPAEQVQALETLVNGMEQQVAHLQELRDRFYKAVEAMTTFQVCDHTAILKVVARCLNLKPQQILAKTRVEEIVWPRNIAMYFERKYLSLSLTEIGVHYPNPDGTPREHSTVFHAIKRVESRMESEAEFKKRVGLIEVTLQRYFMALPPLAELGSRSWKNKQQTTQP